MTIPNRGPLPGNSWDLLDGTTPTVPPLVSVVVAHYRQPKQLARTLSALARQDHPQHRLEIIVADDGSPAPVVVPDGIRVVRQDDAGFRLSAVRNLGASAAQGDVLVFLDADTTPEPAFIRELTRLPALCPDCVTVGHRRHAELDGLAASARIEEAAPSRRLPDPAWLSNAYAASENLLHADDRSYRYMIGAVLACSRSFFEATGGFDESFDRYGGEDWEWAYRAWMSGGLFAHVASAVAWHDGPDAAGRVDRLSAKNAEAMRLADLIPLPGSRPHGLRSFKVDVAVMGPPEPTTAGARFVSLDSALTALPGAEPLPAEPVTGTDARRFDRVRLWVEILAPARFGSGSLLPFAERAATRGLGELLLTSADGTPLVRLVSARARARSARWARDDLFPSEIAVLPEAELLPAEPDVEAYLGGWG